MVEDEDDSCATHMYAPPNCTFCYVQLEIEHTVAELEALGAPEAPGVIIPHHETFSTTIQPPYSSTKG
jgi:hypothetical protein